MDMLHYNLTILELIMQLAKSEQKPQPFKNYLVVSLEATSWQHKD